jgi:hypothetical protein
MSIITTSAERRARSASRITPSSVLRGLLAADAATSAGAGLLMLLGGDILAAPLGLPAALLHYAGLALLPFAALVGWLATRGRAARGAVWTVVAVNLAWVVDSVLLLLSGWVEPTMLGYGFVILQALAVAVFAELQIIALKRSKTTA